MLKVAGLAAGGTLRVHHDRLTVRTVECLQFVDLTDTVADLVRGSGVQTGFVNVQSHHTTAALILNEAEPLLVQDMKDLLEAMAPRDRAYRHDDFSIRTVNMEPDEPENGHAHCKALFLATSQTLNVVDGALQLGRWQRLFLVELDRARERTVSLVVLGA